MANTSKAVSSAFTEISKKCEGKKIKFEPEEITEETQHIRLRFPTGRSYTEIRIRGTNQANFLLRIPFEKVHCISGYRAIFSPEDSYIEALLSTGDRGLPTEYTIRRLSKSANSPDNSENADKNKSNRITLVS